MKRSSVILGAVGTLLCLLSMAYVSCTKTGLAPKCNGVICLNGGYCDSGICKCPIGFDGVNCGTAVVSKYVKTWDVHQTITGSDSANYVGNESDYQVILQKTATPTTFFINNFANNPNYNYIVCLIDSLDSSNFTLDTAASLHQHFDSYRMLAGKGHISVTDTTITARFYVKHLNYVINWQNDTLDLILKPHHF